MPSQPPPIEDDPAPADAPRQSRLLWLRRLGLLLGGALVVAAVVVVWRQQDTLAAALGAIRRPDPVYVAVLVAGVVANVALTGLMFSLLMSRYGRVGVLEMQALIAAATLANYLPLRPGLFGRIAYHKTVNRILAMNSARTIVQASIISVVIVAYLAAVLGILGRTPAAAWGGMLAPLVVLPGVALVPSMRLWTAAALVRYVEVLVWASRYYAAFALIDSPIGPTAALALACVSMIATMIPFVSNGLGLREWGIGLAAPLLTVHVLELGITAELVNRAAEVVVVLVLGLSGAAYLAAKRRRSGTTS
jgi:hypothetical protein